MLPASEAEPTSAKVALLFDDRWVADNGIGRVAREWRARGSGWTMLGPGPSPASPLDPLWLTKRLRVTELPFLTPAYNAPLVSRQPFFITVHDLCYLDLATRSGRLRQIYFMGVVRARAHAAAAVFTASEFSRQRIIDVFRLAADRVHVYENGLSQAFSVPGKAELSTRPYVLCVSNGSPHKNEGMTLRAFERSSLARTHDLVFTGKPRALDGLQPRAVTTVRFTGRVDDEHLARLYRGAAALVFVSLYEGFGLPALEAMACGTPVVCSKMTSLGELADGAALLVDPRSEVDIAQALEAAVRVDPLRDDLRRRGLERAKRYSWEAGVRSVEAVVRRTLDRAKGLAC